MKPDGREGAGTASATSAVSPGSRPAFLQGLCLLALSVLTLPAAGDTRSMEDQLARMSLALRTLSYEGVLVYAHDDRLETLRIVRRVRDGRVHEQLESLNGPVRVVTTEQDKVTCKLSDDSPILVRSRGHGGDLLRPKALDPEALSTHYLIHPLGEARVAGRQTAVVGIIPRDALRYGYRFYLDDDSGLPLKSDLMDAEARPIQQIIFTSLTLEPGAAPVTEPAAAVHHQSLSLAPAGGTGPWRFDQMPAGFELVMADRAATTAGSDTEHYVLSDGLASVSVYIERDMENGLRGGTRIGAVHAVGGVIADHQVTVVGEVPAATVQLVLAGIVHGGGGAE
jgi:sigma-E factor negative regulatory protein RseB